VRSLPVLGPDPAPAPRLRHVLLTVTDSHGFQYGHVRDLEDEIVRITGAQVVPIPAYCPPGFVQQHLSHGTRWAPLRRLAPARADFAVDADVLWLVLMGPEASWLDLYRGWDRRVGKRIVYVFDTFEEQRESLRRLAGAARWDVAATSFHGALPMLERETGRAWAAVPQGVKLDRFTPAPEAERLIAMCSYGRRIPAVHEAVDRFCDELGLHHEVSIAASLQTDISPRYLYKQYAWHLCRSFFAFSWPVELTHPARAGSFSPVTCRWFEAAAAGATMVGRPPSDPVFRELFGDGAVVPFDPAPRTPGEARKALASLWARREELLREALARRAALSARWTWEARVREMMALAGVDR
jgi:hypothetical protein